MLTTSLFLCFLFLPSQEAKIEYGYLDDLHGVTRIFVFTGAELELRNNIVKEIQKKLKNIVMADSAEEAEICLIFGADFNTFYAGTTASGTVSSDGSTVNAQSTPQYRTVIYGSGTVVKLKPNNVVRLIMSFGDSRSTVWERRPSTNFARAFVKAYQEANKQKK